MRVALVNPPHETPFIREGRCQSPQSWRKNSIPQMTLAYAAGLFRRSGHYVRVYDCIGSALSTEDLLSELGDRRPDVAFVNTTTPTITKDLAFVTELKNRFPNTVTAVFGCHVTARHEQVIAECPELDVVIRREPEFTAMDLLNVVDNGRLTAGVPGCTARISGRVEVHPNREFEEDLDRLDRPDWSQLPLDQYVHPVFNRRYLSISTSRGCKHNCIFCVAPTYYGRTVRRRSPASVVDEIRRNIADFGINHYWFYADDFTDSPDYVKALCQEIIDADLGIVWWSNTRVDKLDEEMFRLMRKSGAVMLSIGGESGSLELLKGMKKGSTPRLTQQTVSILRKVGIDSVVYFLFGLPGETRETARQTIEFAKHANPDFVEFYPATPYPGTGFYDHVVQQGFLVDSDWDRYQYDANVVQNPDIPPEVIRKMIKRAYLEFYLRPGYMPILMRRLSKPRDFARLVDFGFGYLRRILS